jgi:hypothetical protein
MPQPLPTDMHVDKFLTDLSIAYFQQASNFVAGKVFPIVPVSKSSDVYPIFDRSYFWRDELAVRPLGGEAPRIGYEVTTDTYTALEWAAAHTIDDRVRENADDPLNPDRAAANLLTQQALVHLDKVWATTFFGTTIWGTDRVGDPTPTGDQFLHWNSTGSDPIGDIRSSCFAVASQTGYKPNTLVIGTDAYQTLVDHTDIVGRIQYSQTGIVTPELLAAMFDLDNIIVPMSVQNSGVEGAAASYDFILGKESALLCYAAPNPGIEVPSAGYHFAWTGLVPGVMNAFGGVIQRMRLEQAFSDYLVLRMAYTQKLVANDLGVFFSDINA